MAEVIEAAVRVLRNMDEADMECELGNSIVAKNVIKARITPAVRVTLISPAEHVSGDTAESSLDPGMLCTQGADLCIVGETFELVPDAAVTAIVGRGG